MKSAQVSETVEKLLARWRATLPPRYSAAHVDSFIHRHRSEIEALVVSRLARRRAENGERPETAAEFAAYDPIVARERRLTADADPVVLARLMAMVDADLAEGYGETTIFNNLALEYIDTRTEAILLEKAGWDPVPLLLPRPALAVLASGSVVALRDTMGGLSIHPDRRGTLNHLYAAMRRVEERILQLREIIDIETNTKERLVRYATAMWARARAETTNM